MQNLKVNNNICKPKYNQKGFLLFVVLMAFIGCTNNTFNTEKELWKYLENEKNGYRQHKTINGVDFTLLYKPTDLLVKQELGNHKDKEKIKELRKKYSKYLYFNLSMSINNKELLSIAPKNRNEFGAMVHQLAFGMHKKIHVFNSKKDTLELIDYVYPRMYGMSKSTSMLFVFPRDKTTLNEDELNFTIEDLGLYTGEVKFKIGTKRIKEKIELTF